MTDMTSTKRKKIIDDAQPEASENGQPEPLTEEDTKNLIALLEVGAKAMSHDKPLNESAQIQAVALRLIAKLQG